MHKKQHLLWLFCNSISLNSTNSFKSSYFVNSNLKKVETMFYSTVPVNSPGKSEREVLPFSAEGKKRDRKPVITFVTGNKKK